jgi:hypothetical protein
VRDTLPFVALQYGLADFDRYTGMVEWNSNLPMDRGQSGGLYEFLSSAAENGWELCACFPSGTKGSTREIPGTAETVECQDRQRS